MVRTLPALVLGVTIATAVPADSPPPSPSADRIATLVADLGSPEYRIRREAAQSLNQLGRPALIALQTAADRSPDPEIRQAARDLAEKIALRVENEDLIAPTIVRLPAGERPLSEVIADLSKQTGAKFRVADQSLAMKTVTIAKSLELPFWSAVEAVCDSAGVEIASEPPSSTVSLASDDQFSNVATDMKRITDERLVLIRKIQEQMKLRANGKANEKEIKALDEAIAKLKDDLKQNIQQLAQVQAKMMVQQRQRLNPAPTPPTVSTEIVLQPKSGRVVPTLVSGAVLIAALPIPDAIRPTVPASELPILLQIQPEPRLKWQQIDSVSVAKAIDEHGRECSARSGYNVMNSRVQPVGGGAVVVDARGGVNLVPNRGGTAAAFVPTPFQSVVVLAPPTGTTPNRLQLIAGTIRGRVRTPPKDVVAVDDLVFGKSIRSESPDGTVLTATVAPSQKKGQYTIDLMISYDPQSVTPAGEVDSGNQTMIHNRGQGVLVAQRVVVNSHNGHNASQAFVVTDDDGAKLQLTVTSSTNRLSMTNGQASVNRTMRMLATANDEASVPARIAFQGTSVRTVEVPFQFRDLAVTGGTGPVNPE